MIQPVFAALRSIVDRCQARTQAVTEFRQVLKVPDTLFTTLHASGTPVKKHLTNVAFLGQTDEVGSLGDDTYVTVQESPPDGTREPRNPLHNTMPSQAECLSTAPMATGSAMEPPIGGTSTPIRDSPLQGGLFAITLALPLESSMPFQVHMLQGMMKKGAVNATTWNGKVRSSLTPSSTSQAPILGEEGVQ